MLALIPLFVLFSSLASSLAESEPPPVRHVPQQRTVYVRHYHHPPVVYQRAVFVRHNPHVQMVYFR